MDSTPLKSPGWITLYAQCAYAIPLKTFKQIFSYEVYRPEKASKFDLFENFNTKIFILNYRVLVIIDRIYIV